ncbi:hypothetical protein AC249_AIPGENE23354 [Exaiptasia diaphana]|nr:hypothetical protein AC249_AIPGENE23354 [Exaiptasia diaphana]
MEFPSVVYRASEYADRATNSNSSEEEHSGSPSEGKHTSTEPSPATAGMQSIRGRLAEQGGSNEIADVIMWSWRPGTRKQYNGC